MVADAMELTPLWLAKLCNTQLNFFNQSSPRPVMNPFIYMERIRLFVFNNRLTILGPAMF